MKSRVWLNIIISLGVTVGLIIFLSRSILNPLTNQAGTLKTSTTGSAAVASSNSGQAEFAQNCSNCHQSVPRSKNLSHVLQVINQGQGRMPGFKGQLDDKVIADIAGYVVSQN